MTENNRPDFKLPDDIRSLLARSVSTVRRKPGKYFAKQECDRIVEFAKASVEKYGSEALSWLIFRPRTRFGHSSLMDPFVAAPEQEFLPTESNPGVHVVREFLNFGHGPAFRAMLKLGFDLRDLTNDTLTKKPSDISSVLLMIPSMAKYSASIASDFLESLHSLPDHSETVVQACLDTIEQYNRSILYHKDDCSNTKEILAVKAIAPHMDFLERHGELRQYESLKPIFDQKRLCAHDSTARKTAIETPVQIARHRLLAQLILSETDDVEMFQTILEKSGFNDSEHINALFNKTIMDDPTLDMRRYAANSLPPLALSRGAWDCLKLLLDNGADPWITMEDRPLERLSMSVFSQKTGFSTVVSGVLEAMVECSSNRWPEDHEERLKEYLSAFMRGAPANKTHELVKSAVEAFLLSSDAATPSRKIKKRL